jgi:hypothetical protein
MTINLSTSSASQSAHSDLRGNGIVVCAAVAVLLAMALFLGECSLHPSLLDDAAITLAGP